MVAEGRGAFCRKPSPPPPPAAAAANIDDGALAGGFRQQIPRHSEGYSLLRFNASHVGVPVVSEVDVREIISSNYLFWTFWVLHGSLVWAIYMFIGSSYYVARDTNKDAIKLVHNNDVG